MHWRRQEEVEPFKCKCMYHKMWRENITNLPWLFDLYIRMNEWIILNYRFLKRTNESLHEEESRYLSNWFVSPLKVIEYQFSAYLQYSRHLFAWILGTTDFFAMAGSSPTKCQRT